MANEKRVDRGTRAPRVTVHVTEEIINTAKRRDSSHCMISEAVQQAVPEAKSVSTDLQSVRWTDRKKGLRYTYLTPREAQVALLQFDQGDENIKPFSVTLRGALVTRANTKKDTAAKRSIPKRASFRKPKNAGPRAVPERVGGSPPPVGPLTDRPPRRNTGKRRSFGLRQLIY